MTILSFLLLLIVVAVIIYGIKLAIDGNWKQLIITVAVLFCVIWILSALGVSLPSIPRVN